MRHFMGWLAKRSTFLFLVALSCTSALAAQLAVDNYALRLQYEPLAMSYDSSSTAFHQITTEWREKFLVVTKRNDMLASTLDQEQLKNFEFQAQLNGIRGSVDYLQKLSETDKELLQKYSKVYFLNENYIPSALATIEPRHVLNQNNSYEIHAKVLPYLKSMIDTAETAGIHLRVVSAYRSFGAQAALKSGYKVTYGSGANKFSADQGYSEHQLGSTVDLTTTELGDAFTSFEKATAYTWLVNNAHTFGFVLSYPKGNSFYVFEPWHWRFVGTALATRLHSENKAFYDMEQRDIDKYLALIFN